MYKYTLRGPLNPTAFLCFGFLSDRSKRDWPLVGLLSAQPAALIPWIFELAYARAACQILVLSTLQLGSPPPPTAWLTTAFSPLQPITHLLQKCYLGRVTSYPELRADGGLTASCAHL